MRDPRSRLASEIQFSSPVDGEVVGAVSVVEKLDYRAELVSLWPLVICGTLAAIFAAYLVCWFPVPLKSSRLLVFVRAIVCVLITAQAGYFGVVLWRRRLTVQPSINSKLLSLHVGMSWVFLPCIMLLYLQHSVWVLVVTVIAAAIVAVQIRSIYPDGSETGQKSTSRMLPDGVPTFAALPMERSGWWRTPLISLCAQVSLFPILAGYFFVASILLTICSCLLAWRLSALKKPAMEAEKVVIRRWVSTSAIAIFITWLALISWGSGGSAAHSLFGGGGAPRKVSPATQRSDSSRDFVGIILWPPPQKKVKVISPPPHDRPSMSLKASEPIVIPFDGPYWYYKAPHKAPGAKAHVVHGKSTLVNIRSTDWSPLLMEAHQNLGSAIDLGCCKEVDVAVTNADNRVGEIAIGVVLTDSSSPGKPSQYLGTRTIVSSEAAHIAINRAPVEEVLRFPIPQFEKIHHFDEITVVFLPAKERARGGAKVSIQNFKLIPR